MERLTTAAGHVLVLPVFFVDDLLRLGQQHMGGFRVGVGERAIALLVIGIILERDRRPRRVQAERPFADRTHHWVESEQRPVAARRRQVLLLHTVAQIEAVRDAVAVSEDQRWAAIGLRLPEREQGLLRIRAHRHLGDVDVSVSDRLQRQVLARDALAGRGEFCNRTKRRCLG